MKNKHTLWAVLLLSACLALGLTACDKDSTSADGTSSETESTSTDAAEDESASGDESDTEGESGSADESDNETEAEDTLASLPRYDYLGNDVLPFVTVDPSIYTDMRLTLPSEYQVTDAMVDASILSLRVSYRTKEDLEGDGQMTDRPMELGDSAFIYYRGELDGVAFNGGSNWDDEAPYELVLGSSSFISGFEEGLVGVIPEDTSRENPYALHVTFPEDYQSTELAGKAVIFYVYVEYAVAYDLPALDRAFIVDTLKYEPEKDNYADDGELSAEFTEYIREALEAQIAEEVDAAKSEALWRYLIDNATFTQHPEEELAYYIAYYEDNVTSAYAYYCAMGGESFTTLYPTIDDFATVYIGLEDGQDWHDTIEALAKTVVERDLIIHAIGEQENMETVTDEEFDKEIQYYIDYYQQTGTTKTREEIIDMLGGENSFRMTAFKIKMEEWLLERATFTFED